MVTMQSWWNRSFFSPWKQCIWLWNTYPDQFGFS